ncbi:uncharacterized protein GIQ15_03887 [Arthroderma uncinatum]|uniref:uncharacterized protein n=1 Tax=Arthroderma uncinatum TaxID=74035 RepID=UPI00144A8452|nr:uncharacterized protein GIQ15_03887 [Arthroderma uncinatum]KAF3481128.1 hypothetical protein GIQ15_03887 [Arthroderma uncinatum]
MAAPSATTTLMTFLVRTPPTTRSVSLFGSWDNFAKGYRMEKDSRTGRGHWRGCHTFTNIICDGHGNPIYPGRDGGLKMGGTYWYYYILDGDFDFYNESEAWTTSCPLLPGQPLNVLNVPIYLPPSITSHGRNDSTSSQLSVQQTMNPEDKYINPRPPPRPQLPRLATSPAALAPHEARGSPISPAGAHPTHGRSFSQPRAASRKFRVGGKLSLDLKLPMSSLAPKSSGLRTAFLNRVSPRSASHENPEKYTKQGTPMPEIGLTRSTPVASPAVPNNQSKSYYLRPEYPGTYSSSSSALPSPCGSPADLVIDDRLLAAPGFDYSNDNSSGPSYPTSHGQSRSRSKSPAHTPLRNSINYDASPKSSDTSSRTLEVPCKLDVAPSPTDLYSKRLPTLPNSPSSVLDESYGSMWTSNYPPLDLEHLHSHFSKSTVASRPDSPLLPGGSRFSECSTDTEIVSPCSMTSSSTFNNETNSPDNYNFSTSTSLDSNLSSIGSEHNKDEPISKNYTDCFGISDLHIDHQSIDGVKDEPPFSWMTSDPFSDENPSRVASGKSSFAVLSPRTQGFNHNEDHPDVTIHNMMQELIDEMSYLGDMIDASPDQF